MILGLNNPIPESVKDTGAIAEVFSSFRVNGKQLVPYYGEDSYTSHSMLKTLQDVSKLSPSNTACISEIAEYAFGGDLTITEKSIAGFKKEDFPKDVNGNEQDSDLPYNEQKAFAEHLVKLGIPPMQIKEITTEMFKHYNESGNAYLHIKFVKAGSTFKVFIKPIHYRYCAYLRTKRGQDRKIVVVDSWADFMEFKNAAVDKRYTNPPTVYPASTIGDFKYKKTKNNVFETVLHIKNKNDASDWYGRPNILSCLFWMYAEHALADLSCKVNSTETIAKNIVFFEQDDMDLNGDDNQDDHFKSMVHVLKDLTTAQGNHGTPSSLAAIEYPNGTQAPTVATLDVNRDERWFDTNIEKASSYIYSIHGWSRQLSGFSSTRYSIGSKVLVEMFLIKNTSTIQPTQRKWESMWSGIFDEVSRFTGDTIYNNRTIKFEDNINELLKSLQYTESNAAAGEEGQDFFEDDFDEDGDR